MIIWNDENKQKRVWGRPLLKKTVDQILGQKLIERRPLKLILSNSTKKNCVKLLGRKWSKFVPFR